MNRRDFLSGGFFTGIAGMSGCLRLTTDGETSATEPSTQSAGTNTQTSETTTQVSLPSSDWPMFRLDGQNSSFVKNNVNISGDWGVRWDNPFTRTSIGYPVVVNESIYATTINPHTLYSFDKKSGTKQWETSLDANPTSPAVVGDIVAVDTAGGTTYGFDREDGSLQWEYSDTSELYYPLQASDQTLVGSSKTGNFAIEASTGSELWTSDKGYENSEIRVQDDTVFAFSNKIHEIDLATGETVYSSRELGWGVADQLIHRDDVFATVTGEQDKLVCWDFDERSNRWELEDVTAGQPVPTRTAVIIVPTDNGYMALDRRDGSTVWERTDLNYGHGTSNVPSVIGGYVFASAQVSGDKIQVVVLDPSSGDIVKTISLARPNANATQVVTDGNWLYLANNGLTALGPTDDES